MRRSRAAAGVPLPAPPRVLRRTPHAPAPSRRGACRCSQCVDLVRDAHGEDAAQLVAAALRAGHGRANDAAEGESPAVSAPEIAAATGGGHSLPAWDSKRVHAALRRGGHPRCLVPARGDGAAHDLSDAGQVAGGGRPRADPPRGDGRRANEVLRGHGACRRRHAEPAHREDGAGSARPGRCARPGPGAGEGTALSVPGIAETGARIRRPAHL